ncbi:MAG: lipoyl(octanoyl) transferase LipB [Bdellovibrionota bacterium]
MTESNCISPTEPNSISSEKDFATQARWMGVSDYIESLKIQKAAMDQVRKSGINQILGFEYEKVVTAGVQVKEAEVNFLQHCLRPQNYQVIPTSRGGQFTLHGKGQLVIYPIVDLRSRGIGVRAFIELCLKTTVHFLALYGISAELDLERAGVYTPRGKIAFCGFKIERGISHHGLSINVQNDLEEFKLITPCGTPNLTLDLMRSSSKDPLLNMESLFYNWTRIFEIISKSNV